MYKAHKYLLKPTDEQIKLLAQWEGSTRWLWNQFLAKTTAQYQLDKKLIWGFDLKKTIPELKKQHEWLKLTPAHALQNVAFNLDAALKRSTGKNRDLGFPKFKSKHRGNGSIKIDQVNGHIKISEKSIVLPKIGSIKWVMHRALPESSKVKSVTVSKDTDGKWFVAVLCEIPEVELLSEVNKDKTIGIDLGVAHFATCSDGSKIASPNYLKKQLKYLKKQQRRLKNKVKGSANIKKQYLKIAKTHKHIRCQRSDFLHKLSNQVTNDYDVICVENLKIKELLVKKQMSRAISDQGWGIFVGQLQYKAEHKGKHLTKIGTYQPSTKTCSCCGSIRNMKLTDRVYVCENPKCNDYLKTKDRDVNAARNILFWGLMQTPDVNYYCPSNGTGTVGMTGSGSGKLSEPVACGDTNAKECQAYDWHLSVSAKQEAALPLGTQ